MADRMLCTLVQAFLGGSWGEAGMWGHRPRRALLEQEADGGPGKELLEVRGVRGGYESHLGG